MKFDPEREELLFFEAGVLEPVDIGGIRDMVRAATKTKGYLTRWDDGGQVQA